MAARELPIIDVSPLIARSPGRKAVARALGEACREAGFFYVVGHGIDQGLQDRLEALSRRFFALDLATKMEIAMPKAGRAWRGFFPVGDELTSGKPDLKEGLYFGSELGPDHPDVRAGLPLHGANQFPTSVPELRPVVLEYLRVMTELGHALMEGLALSLELDEAYFYDRYTADPLVLFRIFNYPAPSTPAQLASTWGVGEHTDYGVLTILKQDDSGGLEVKSSQAWIAAPPVAGSFVCNIGDMLDRMTGGLYRSTPHRVRNASGRDRLSWPFFFDPNFHVEVGKLPLPPGAAPRADAEERWDKADVHAFRGSYGDYVLRKVGKVFPALKDEAL
jgi:isopenicillin N synthase-like dioxygenase